MMQPAQKLRQLLTENIGRVIVGKEGVVELILNAILCGGHVLIEDVPGVGKTTLASAFARSLALDYKRIQFTPDVTPSDVVGYTFIDFKTNVMEYRKGAVFANLLLADEINRTSPKTQSSLLEVMEEGQVTLDGETHPLPEAQLDRFFMRVSIGYPTEAEEAEILNMYMSGEKPLNDLQPVCTREDILRLQKMVGEVRVSKEMRAYVAAIAQNSRTNRSFARGISTRGALALMRSAQACAMLDGRDYVMPEDIRKMASPVLSHRVVLSPEARLSAKGMTAERAVLRLIAGVPVPVRAK